MSAKGNEAIMKINKPLLLSKEFFPDNENNIKDLAYFRSRLQSGNNANLNFLVHSRYEWMKAFISPQMKGLEIGAGIGASKFILKDYNYIMTDCYQHKWIENVVDACDLPYDNGSFDYIIASNVIHHLNKPMLFFKEAHRVLKNNGLIVINDVSNSFAMRFLLKTLKHEGYSYERNPFDMSIPMNSKTHPWSGNDAVMDIMFQDHKLFTSKTKFKIEKDKRTEFFIFLLSGGISSEFFTVNLPLAILKLIDKLDRLLCMGNNIFPLSRKSVLRKLEH